jgi:triacylglycerol lipase
MVTQASGNPVLLVHGISDTRAVFDKMARYLSGQGYRVHSLDLLPNNGGAGLDELAQQVADYTVQTFAPDQPIDLIGFSMGGIVSRYYLQRLGGVDRVHRFISISSPHKGTWVAFASQLPGAVQMRPDCVFLRDLNQDLETLSPLNVTSIWTPFDLMIVPANSSELPIGTNIKVSVPAHSMMLNAFPTMMAVVAALEEPLRYLKAEPSVPIIL